MTARIPCEHWKPAKTLSRGDSAWERVRTLLGPSRAISGVINRAYHSIGSAYQSNCINGYRQRSHDVISESDSSNVPKHQVRLQLQTIENHSQKGHQVTVPLQCKRTIEQTYYRTGVLSNQVSLRLHDIENQSQQNTKSVYSFTITIRIAPQNPITIMISIAIRSEFVSRSENDHDSYQHQKLIRIMILARKIPSLNTNPAGPNTTLAGP